MLWIKIKQDIGKESDNGSAYFYTAVKEDLFEEVRR